MFSSHSNLCAGGWLHGSRPAWIVVIPQLRAEKEKENKEVDVAAEELELFSHASQFITDHNNLGNMSPRVLSVLSQSSI